MDEDRYLLNQKVNHLDASLESGKNTPINDIDSDNLHK